MPLLAKVLEVAEAYNTACMVGCKVIDTTGNIRASFHCPEMIEFCQLASADAKTEKLCRNSLLYGGCQSEKLGHYYIYFCPLGFGNWAVPVYGETSAEYYLIGGPVLLHDVDHLLIERITGHTAASGMTTEQLKRMLRKIPVVDATRVRYLAKVLLFMAKSMMPDKCSRLEEQRQFSEISAQIVSRKDSAGIPAFELENELIVLVKIGDRRGAREILNEILGEIYFTNSSFEFKKSRLIALAAVLASASVDAGADSKIVFGIEHQYLQEMEKTRDLMELSTLLAGVLERLIECAFSLRNVKNKDVIYKSMDYICRHYGENISLEDVARKVNVHPTYLSRLFKDETEMTYTEYLNRVRIEAAKQLIRQKYELVQVAQKVGFNDQSYFSKVFKKIEGMPPGKWRSSRPLGNSSKFRKRPRNY